ncbi:Xfu1 transposase [Xanthomonas citri pv. fuscans]|nr:Xfu1 transposase [Xanthomonas citri pv. fuscans]
MQLTFGDAEYDGKRKRTRREVFLAEMEQVVPWKELLGLIEPHYPKSGQPGRQPYRLETMLRIHFLQQWYALSDPSAEELERLAAASVARVAGRVGDRLMLVMTEVFGHLRVQRPLHQPLGQLLEQAVLADQILGFGVVDQQAAKQLVGYLMCAWAHGVSGLGGSLLPVARLHKI